MIKQAPKVWQLALMAAFVLSCFGTLLYLWLSFGGTSPLAAKGYRFHAYFPEATQLAQQADVRISGVPVGKVIAIKRGPDNTTDTTIELKAKYAPIPKDVHAMLRTKTLLGETYVDLSPGNASKGMLAEGAALPHAAITSTVELDEIFRSFDKKTRAAFRTWMQSSSLAVAGRGPDINAVFGNLPGLSASAEDLLRELNAQSGAVRQVVSSTGDVFDALSERQGQLRALVTESNRLFGVTAARNQDLAAIFRELPRFERESRITLPRLTEFGNVAMPTVKQLQPAATEMAPAFDALNRLSPEAKSFFSALGPAIDASKRAVPAFDRVATQLPPLLEDFQPFLRNVNPIVQYLGLNQREIAALLGNFVGATNGRSIPGALQVDGKPAKNPANYLRATAPLGPEALTFYSRALGASRGNAYALPNTGDRLASNYPVYDTRSCTNGDVAPPATADPPELKPLVLKQAFRTNDTDVPSPTDRNVLKPQCIAQGPFPGYGTSFPQLRVAP
jgi:phospholipid/cholesterol/gamma-HCH transport system substrate-binding protein